MNRKLLFVVFLAIVLGCISAIWAQTTITLGAQEVQSGTTGIGPTNYYWEARRIQWVYTASEIIAAGGSAGTITSLAYDVSQIAGGNLVSYRVKMAHTSATDASAHNTATLTTVKTSHPFVPGATGWRTIVFDTGFDWDGVSNILFDVSWGVNPGYSSTGQVWLYNNVANQMRGATSGSSSVENNTTTATRAGKPRAQLTIQSVAGVANPTLFTATAVNHSQINLSWTPNSTPDNVMVAFNSVNTFGTPVDGMAYDPITNNSIPGGGTVIFNGSGTAYNHTPLSESTPYYYKAWSVGDDGAKAIVYSPGVTASATTLPAPISTFPWTEGFEAGFPPAGWTNSNWDESLYGGANSGSEWAYSNTTGSQLTTLEIQIPDDAFTYGLSFWYRVESSSYPQNIDVMLSTDGVNFGTTVASIVGATNATYLEVTYNLALYSGNSIWIRFIGQSGVGGWDYGICVDDVSIDALPAAMAPTGLSTTGITGQSAILGWTENNTPPAAMWDIVYGAPGFDPDLAAPVSVSVNPHPLSGLSPSTTYQWYVRSDTGAKAISAWAGPASFSTTQVPATLPYAENFESWPSGWTIDNGSMLNKWQIGTATYRNGGNSAYVSDDGGTTNNYNTGMSSVVHMYRDIEFTSDSQKFDLSFWWKGQGESGYDYLRVYLVETTVTPVAGSQLTTQIGGTYNLQADWTEATIEIPGTHSGTVKRLVFSWRNDFSDGTQPPAAIDDISLTATPIPTEPAFSIDPTTWDYLSVQVGTPVTKSFRITNTGGATLYIDKDEITIDPETPQFVITPLAEDISLGMNAWADITVTFTPTAEVLYEADILIIDNIAGTKAGARSASKANRRVSIRGLGFDPTIDEFDHLQGFDGTVFPPLGWAREQISGPGTGLWDRQTAGTYPTCSPVAGAAMARFNCYSYSAGTRGILVSAPINFGSADYFVDFWMYRDDEYLTNPDLVNIYYNNTPNLADASLLGTVNRSIELAPVVETESWYQYSFPVEPAKGKAMGYIIFEGVSAYGNNIFIDEIVIREEPVLPVELSSFTAVLTVENYVSLTWVTQSETGVMGYYVYRSNANDLSGALSVSPLIDAANSSEPHTYKFTDAEIYEDGTYYYWLQNVDFGGTVDFHGPVSIAYSSTGGGQTPEIPLFTELKPVYPNPFNPVAFIPFSIATWTNVNIRIFNTRGQLLRDFAVGDKEPGQYRITWDGRDANGKACGNGIYYIVMHAGAESFQRKTVLMK